MPVESDELTLEIAIQLFEDWVNAGKDVELPRDRKAWEMIKRCAKLGSRAMTTKKAESHAS